MSETVNDNLEEIKKKIIELATGEYTTLLNIAKENGNNTQQFIANNFNLEFVQKNLLKDLPDDVKKKFNEVTFKKTIQTIKKRVKTKANDIYKIQSLSEQLEFQKNICPGGMRYDGDYGQKLKDHSDNLNTLLNELMQRCLNKKIVISNEALRLKLLEKTEKQPNGGNGRLNKDLQEKTIMLNTKNKEWFSCTGENIGEYAMQEIGKENEKPEVYSCGVVDKNEKKYYTSHFSSIKEKDRKTKSNEFAKTLLGQFIEKLKKHAADNDKTFGGFAGDINLYLTNDDNTTLRDGVQAVLDKHNLVLIVAGNKIDKNARPAIHDQWHKIEKEYNPAPRYVNDSLVVLENYDNTKLADYEKLSKKNEENGREMNVFLPAKKTEETEIAKKFIFNGGTNQVSSFDNKHCITDHNIVEGLELCIFSGADGDGIGNKVKKFLPAKNLTDILTGDDEIKIHKNLLQLIKNTNTMLKIINGGGDAAAAAAPEATAEKPAGEPAEKPAGEPVEKPAGEPATSTATTTEEEPDTIALINLFDSIGFSHFKINQVKDIKDILDGQNIKDKVSELFVGESSDNLTNIIKNDAIMKEVFKDENREAEAIEDIKKKIEEFKSNEKLFFNDLFDFLYKIKQYVIEKNKSTKSIDDFIENLKKKLNKIVEDINELNDDKNSVPEIFRL